MAKDSLVKHAWVRALGDLLGCTCSWRDNNIKAYTSWNCTGL